MAHEEENNVVEDNNQVIVWRQGYPSACFLDNELREQVTCSVCMTPCCKPAHGDLCAHTACRACLVRWAAQRQAQFRAPTCPSCRRALDPALLVENVAMRELVADADVCCIYLAETECDWTGTFGADGIHLVEHVLAQHAAQQSVDERPFLVTNAVHARALEDAAVIVPREGDDLLRQLVAAMRLGAQAAPVPVPAPVVAPGADIGDVMAGLMGPGLEAYGLGEIRAAVETAFQRGDLRQVCAHLQQWMPDQMAQFAAGNHIFFFNHLLDIWLQRAIKLLQDSLAAVPSQTEFFQQLLAQYRAATQDDYVEILSMARLERVRGWVADVSRAFEPLLPLIHARNYAAFYASRPGHLWFDPQHLRRADQVAALEEATTIEEVCENLESENAQFGQDPAHWDQWLQLVSMGTVLYRLPLDIVHTWSVSMGAFWTNASQSEHFDMPRQIVHDNATAWFQHLRVRDERVIIVQAFFTYFELTLHSMLDSIPAHMVAVAAVVWPMIVTSIDPHNRYNLPQQLDSASAKATVTRFITYSRNMYMSHDEPEVVDEVEEEAIAAQPNV
jgi:hypothetical protein